VLGPRQGDLRARHGGRGAGGGEVDLLERDARLVAVGAGARHGEAARLQLLLRDRARDLGVLEQPLVALGVALGLVEGELRAGEERGGLGAVEDRLLQLVVRLLQRHLGVALRKLLVVALELAQDVPAST
jgi:hypothetical protein